jgi:hypothetical protein
LGETPRFACCLDVAWGFTASFAFAPANHYSVLFWRQGSFEDSCDDCCYAATVPIIRKNASESLNQ